LKNSQKYVGIDPAKDFFPYIKKKFPDKKITLKGGWLPDYIKIDGKFDLVICSTVLHCVKSIKKSLKFIFSKLSLGGEVLIIDFGDTMRERIKECKEPVFKINNRYIKKQVILSSGHKIIMQMFFYKERDYEREISKYASFVKKRIGSIFVSYECKKYFKKIIIMP
jgi:ubiquinone/menaquinone biosynthesis C-methylase UbiE